jgi:hypothetical protein
LRGSVAHGWLFARATRTLLHYITFFTCPCLSFFAVKTEGLGEIVFVHPVTWHRLCPRLAIVHVHHIVTPCSDHPCFLHLILRHLLSSVFLFAARLLVRTSPYIPRSGRDWNIKDCGTDLSLCGYMLVLLPECSEPTICSATPLPLFNTCFANSCAIYLFTRSLSTRTHHVSVAILTYVWSNPWLMHHANVRTQHPRTRALHAPDVPMSEEECFTWFGGATGAIPVAEVGNALRAAGRFPTKTELEGFQAPLSQAQFTAALAACAKPGEWCPLLLFCSRQENGSQVKR